MPPPVTHNVTLTNAAATELVRLCTFRGLLAGKSRQKKLAGQFVRDQILRPGLPDQPTSDSVALAWSEKTFVSVDGVNESTREALKSLVRDGDVKGVLDCSLGSCDLLDQFGLSETDAPAT